MYERIYQILDFAQNEATSPEDKSKVAAAKAKLDNYLDGVSTKLADKGVKLVYLPETLPSGTVKKGFYFTGGEEFSTSQEARDLISPNGSGVSSTFKGLTFSNFKETTTKSDSVETVTSVRKEYTLDGNASIGLVKTTTKKSTYLTEKDAILAMYREGEDKTVKSEFSELVKSGNVKVNDDGSVTVTTTETAPTTKFYKGNPNDISEVDDSAKEVQPPSDGVFRLSLEEKERDGISGFRAVSETSHNETTYNKHEVITPVRAYKVVADGTSTVTHYYRLKKAPLNVNYYLENTTTSLAPSENQADLPVKSDYTTQAKTIEPKTEVQDLPEKTVTTVTTYELVSTPDNANGKITEGGTTVNYYYRAVAKITEVAKQAPVTVNYYKEGTTDKLADTIEQGQKDIGSDYTTEAKAIPDKVEVQDLDDRVITKTTSYELVAEPTDKEGKVPVGGKVVNYYYREVVKEDVVMKEFKKVVVWKNETRFDIQHVFDRELEKDITGFDNNSIFLNPEYGTKTTVARRMYDGAIGFSPEGTYYPSVEKINEAEEKYAKILGYESKAQYNASEQGQKYPLDLVARPNGFKSHNTDATIPPSLLSGFYTLSNEQGLFRTRGVNGDLDVIEGIDTDKLNEYESKLPQGAELELTKVTYNIDGGEEHVLSESGFKFSRSKGTMQEGKTTHFTYHYKLKKTRRGYKY